MVRAGSLRVEPCSGDEQRQFALHSPIRGKVCFRPNSLGQWSPERFRGSFSSRKKRAQPLGNVAEKCEELDYSRKLRLVNVRTAMWWRRGPRPPRCWRT